MCSNWQGKKRLTAAATKRKASLALTVFAPPKLTSRRILNVREETYLSGNGGVTKTIAAMIQLTSLRSSEKGTTG